MRRARSIGRLGTASRILVGLLLLSIGIFSALSGSSAWWQLSLGFVGFPTAMTLAQFVRLRLTETRLRRTGYLATCVNCAVLVVLLIAWPTRNATLIFLGGSMLLAAVRGYAGCESLAASNWLLRRDDQFGCLLFSPIDVVESKLGG